MENSYQQAISIIKKASAAGRLPELGARVRKSTGKQSAWDVLSKHPSQFGISWAVMNMAPALITGVGRGQRV